MNKNLAELKYWQSKYDETTQSFANGWYKQHMINMTLLEEEKFSNKVIADFGCGPRGSLAWLDKSSTKIGIDVNVDLYADNFTNAILSHDTIYVKSTEKAIPIPDDYIDILVTMNALDHVSDLEVMCDELIRILKPNGIFAGYFNLEELASPTEPQCLSEAILENMLFSKLDVEIYKTSVCGNIPNGTYYEPLYFPEKYPEYEKGTRGLLWVKAKKR
ncbi:MAG: methyltransferase domain-containing protein [Arcobacteraceae bacterium]